MKGEKLLAFAVMVVTPVVLATVIVVPKIAFVLMAVASFLAIGFLGNPAFVEVFTLLLVAGIIGAIGAAGQGANLTIL